MRRLHKVLKNSSALNLRVWLYGIGQAFSRLSGSLSAKQLYLGTAQGRWLDEWGDLYGISRAVGQSDASYRNVLANIGRWGNPDTANGLSSDIVARTGVACTISLGSDYVIPNDDWQTTFNNGRLGDLDYSDANTGLKTTKQVYLESGAYGPAGLIVFPNAVYTPALMSKIVAVLLDDVTPGVVWDISWNTLAAPPRGDYGLRQWKRVDTLDGIINNFPTLPLFVQQ
jgi:hypothetical protein